MCSSASFRLQVQADVALDQAVAHAVGERLSFSPRGSTPKFVTVELALFCDVVCALARPGYPRADFAAGPKNSLANSSSHVVLP